MAILSVTALRDLAREAMLHSGARGFMRFAREGDALLVTDAASRCADGGAALCDALWQAGFACCMQGGLLHIIPGDALLARLCARNAGDTRVAWDSPLHPAQAFANRLLREADAPLTQQGRRFILETARLCWQAQDQALAGLMPLRAQAARLLREKDRSGFAPAGRLLANWCEEQTKGDLR